MIVEWLAQLGAMIMGWVAGLFPDWELPPELTDPNGMMQQIMSLGQGMEPFVDWAFVAVCAGIPLAVWAIGLGVRAVRALIGHIPQVGGNG